MLNDNNQKRLNELFEDMQNMETAPGSSDRKIADLYKMALDSTKRNAEGAAPLRPYLDEVLAVNDKAALIDAVAKIHLDGENPFFGIYVSSDAMDTDVNVLYMDQSGLGMGDRDYYLDPENAGLKTGYRDFLEKVLSLAGIENASESADQALEVEDAIAADEIMSLLMGEKVEPRREFIEQNSKLVLDLDI